MSRDKFFISLESLTTEITSKILPGSERFGFEQVFGLTKHFPTDIGCINDALKMVACLGDQKMDARFNSRFYPHLDEKYAFTTSTETNETTSFLEESFIVYRANLTNDDEDELGQIAVCKRPDINVMAADAGPSDHHFQKENVSFKPVLN